MMNLKKQSKSLTKEINSTNEALGIFRKRQSETEKKLKELEQHGQRENLKSMLHIITKNKNANKIVKKVVKKLKVLLTSYDISNSHRLNE